MIAHIKRRYTGRSSPHTLFLCLTKAKWLTLRFPTSKQLSSTGKVKKSPPWALTALVSTPRFLSALCAPFIFGRIISTLLQRSLQQTAAQSLSRMKLSRLTMTIAGSQVAKRTSINPSLSITRTHTRSRTPPSVVSLPFVFSPHQNASAFLSPVGPVLSARIWSTASCFWVMKSPYLTISSLVRVRT